MKKTLNSDTYRSSKFRKLLGEWNKKLKDSGFEDIEGWSVTGTQHKAKLLDDLNRNSKRDSSSSKLGKMEKFRIIGIFANNYPNLPTNLREALHQYSNSCTLSKAVKNVNPPLNYNTVKSYINKKLPMMIEFVRSLDNE